MADPVNRTNQHAGEGAPPTHIHVEKDKARNWLPWLLLALGVLALLWFLLKPRHEVAVTTTTATETVAPVAAAPAPAPATPAPADGVVAATTGASIGTLGDYLKGQEPAPRTFTFDAMHFDTAKSDLRSDDQPTLDQVAALLKQYGQTKVRIVGYADARGSEPANKALGQARADAVKAALVKSGIDAGRIETGSGGDQDPAASNATAQGQAENRRTELVVTSR